MHLKVLTLMEMDEEYRIVDICLVLNLKETRTKKILRALVKECYLEVI